MNDEIIVVDVQETAFDRLKSKAAITLANIINSRTMVWLLFDVSFSMNSLMRRYALTDRYEWTDDTLNAARKQFYGDTEHSAENDEQVKLSVLSGALSVPRPVEKDDANAMSELNRLAMAKKCAKEFISRCFRKYPWFKVAIASFSGTEQVEKKCCYEVHTNIRIDCAVKGKDETCTTIDILQLRGGTYIFGACEYMFECCKLSGVKTGHRVVLVSDGHNRSALKLCTLVDEYKKNKIVCNAVFIVSDGSWDPRERADGKAIIDFVKATGGVCEFIGGESDFEQKFLKVAGRKLLTEGSE